jgi:rare lipoprotein A
VVRRAKVCFAAVFSVTVIALPANAMGSSGGSGLSSQSSPSTGTTGQAKNSSIVPTKTVSGDGITLSGRSVALLRGTAWLTGTLKSSQAGQVLEIQLQQAGTWTTVATATTGSGGSFTAAWHPGAVGQHDVRAATASGQSATPPLTVNVYRSSIATMYGPGFYGHHTACGDVLKKHTIGVANRNLPCGSSVSIYYHGRSIVVPVIDRGPYANNANWDLTMATGRALGMTGTSTIGATAVSRAS